MADMFDPRTDRGLFFCLVALYLVTLGLRAFGYDWAENDQSMLLGAVLAILRVSAPPTTKGQS